MSDESREQLRLRLQELDDLAEQLDGIRRSMGTAEDAGNGAGYRRLRDESEDLEARSELLSRQILGHEDERQQRRARATPGAPTSPRDQERDGSGNDPGV